MATTGWCNSAKQELFQAGHCFNATVSTSGTTHTNTTLDGLSSTAGLAVGMAVGGTNIAANTSISAIGGPNAVTLSVAATGSATNTMTFTADVFKILLIKVSPSGTYNNTLTNVGNPGSGSPTTANVGTDEVTGAGYSSGGFPLTNVAPSLTSGVATTSFSPNPSWTSATISTTSGVIYNSSTRNGAAAAPLSGRAISNHDFGGTQTVTSGTLTLVMPTNDNNNAILRIS